MPKLTVPFNQGSYVDIFDFGTRQFSFNLWPTFSEQNGSITPTKVQHTPGLTTFSTTAGGAYGGYMIEYGIGYSILYANWGLNLYQINSDGTNVLKATNVIGSGYPSMVFNGQAIAAIVKGDNSYFYDANTSTLSTITDATFLTIVGSEAVVAVVYIDGRFIFATESTLFAASVETTNRGRNFDANATHEPNYKHDAIRDLLVVDGFLWVIGQVTIEVYDTTGAAGFPLDRVENIILDKGGCVHGRALEFDDSLYLIGRGESEPYGVYVISGNRFVKISNDVIDQQLEKAHLDQQITAQDENSKLFTIEHDGHKFLGLYLSNNNGVTYMYDLTESQRAGKSIWHRRGRIETTNREAFPKDAVNIYNKNLALGHWGTGSSAFTGVAEIDSSIATEFGFDVQRHVSAYYVSNLGDLAKVKRVRVRHKKKVSGNLYLIYSTDRGTTNINMGSRSMADLLEWNRLGKSEDFAFIISNSPDFATPDANSNDVTLYDMVLDIE